MNKLYAFWKYDLFPYVLGGRLIKIHKNGFAEIEGYGFYRFKPILVLPEDEGLRKKELLDNLKTEYDTFMREQRKKWTKQASNIIGLDLV